MINLDSAIVARYYQDVPGANADYNPGQYTFPCNVTLPDLALTIDGIGVTVRGHVLNYYPYDIQNNSKLPISSPRMASLIRLTLCVKSSG